VSKTYTKEWDFFFGAVINHVDTYASFFRSARSRRNKYAVIFAGFIGCDFVIAHNGALGPKLAQVLHQVKDEGVVVIYNEDLGSHVPIMKVSV
jgi:hypothetical protein